MKITDRISYWLLCATIVLGFTTALTAQPAIASLSPSSVTAGGTGFTLTINGQGFTVNDEVQANGSLRTTTYISATQIQAAILAADIAAPGSVTVTVFDAKTGVTSGSAQLIVNAPAPAPVLYSSSSSQVAQGGARLRITLVGANFAPGAVAVISPPLPSLSQSTGTLQATDVTVDSTQFVSSTMLTVYADVSATASTGLRAIDVKNPNGQTTAGLGTAGLPGSSQPFTVTASNALGAPLSVSTVGVISPRNGMVVAQGDDLFGEAAIAGSGSGTIAGAWLWDGVIVEQFTAPISGGVRVTLQSNHTFPTGQIGPHTVQLSILQPNQLTTRAITVVVNPGDFHIQQLLSPAYGGFVPSEESPQFQWAPVPGADHYEIGFSARPYLGSIDSWYEAKDNTWSAPAEVWKNLPDGTLYWTVRVVEMTGDTRQPLAMRPMHKYPANSLSTRGELGRTARGNPLLTWFGLPGKYYYRVEVFRDAEELKGLRRYLTAEPKLDLRALRGLLYPGNTYYWIAEAVAPDGRTVLTGPEQSFIAPVLTSALTDARQPQVLVASLRPFLPALPFAIDSMDLTAALATRAPLPNSTVFDPETPISIVFNAQPDMQEINMMVDGTDISSLVQNVGDKISYTPALPLANGSHDVNLMVGQDATEWKYSINAPQAPPAAAPQQTDAEPPPASTTPQAAPQVGASTSTPTPTTKAATKPAAKSKWNGKIQISSTTTYPSGSNPKTNMLTLGAQMAEKDGPWKLQVNGNGLLNSTFGPSSAQTSHGIFDNYIMEVTRKKGSWGMKLRFGTIAPDIYTDSQFVTTATPRTAAESSLFTPGGTFSFFANTDDIGLGGGIGFNFHQQMLGAGWQLPLPKKYAEMRLMWLSSVDTGTGSLVGQPGNSDTYGGLLKIHLAPHWLWTSEYAWSYLNPQPGVLPHRVFGSAWRSGVDGAIGKATMNVTLLDVGNNFGSSANPALTPMGQSDRRGLTSTLSLPVRGNVFSFNENYMQSNFDMANYPEQLMNATTESWSRHFTPKTTVTLNSNQTLTTTGTVPAAVKALPLAQQLALETDSRDINVNATISQQIKKLALNLSATRDWFHNNLDTTLDTINSSLMAGESWNATKIFQLSSNFSLNWVAADAATQGTTRNFSGFLQPSVNWQRAHFQVLPQASYNQNRTLMSGSVLSNNMQTGQYGGELSWTMPGRFRISTLSVQGNYNIAKNTVMHTDQRFTNVMAIWTLTWGKNFGK